MEFWPTVLTVLGGGTGAAILGQVAKKALDLNIEKATQREKAAQQVANERAVMLEQQRELFNNLQETVDALDKKNNNLELRIESQRKRIDELLGKLDELADQNTQLRIQNRILAGRVRELEEELDKFNRRVYYIPKKEGETP